MKNLENFALMLCRNADAVVFDSIDATSILDPPGDADKAWAAWFEVFNRVVDKVREYLVDLGGVAEAGGEVFDLQGGAGFFDLKLGGPGDFAEDGVHIEPLDAQRGATQAGEAEKASEQFVHFRDASLDEGERFGNFFGKDRAENFLFNDVACGFFQALFHLLARPAEFVAEALDVDQGRPEVVGCHVNDRFEFLVLFGQFLRVLGDLFLVRFARGDVRANCDVLNGFPGGVQERENRRVHPVIGSVPGSIADFTVPDFALGDRAPKFGEEGLGMMSGVDDAMILAEKFFARVFRNLAKLVVDVSDVAGGIGDGDNGMRVQSGFDVAQFIGLGLEILQQFD